MPNLLDNEHERENDGGEENEGSKEKGNRNIFTRNETKPLK